MASHDGYTFCIISMGSQKREHLVLVVGEDHIPSGIKFQQEMTSDTVGAAATEAKLDDAISTELLNSHEPS